MNYLHALKSAKTYIEHSIIACSVDSKDLHKLQIIHIELSVMIQENSHDNK